MATQEDGRKTLVLRVIDARPEDIGRGIAKLAPEDLETLGLAIGDMISLMGKRRTVAKAMRTYVKDTNKGFIALDQVLRANAQAALAEQVTVEKMDVQTAQRVVLSPVSAVPGWTALPAATCRPSVAAAGCTFACCVWAGTGIHSPTATSRRATTMTASRLRRFQPHGSNWRRRRRARLASLFGRTSA